MSVDASHFVGGTSRCRTDNRKKTVCRSKEPEFRNDTVFLLVVLHGMHER